MKKLVINTCFGGFSLSKKAMGMLGIDDDYKFRQVERDNLALVQVVEKLGEDASGRFACLKVVEIPDETTDYIIDDYDGDESVIYVVDGKIHRAIYIDYED